jgi:hypothetical protein
MEIGRHLECAQQAKGGEAAIEDAASNRFFSECTGQLSQIEMVDRQIDVELLLLIERHEQIVRGPPTLEAEGQEQRPSHSARSVKGQFEGLELHEIAPKHEKAA